ncbi:MAG TPA: hypothetical protein VGL53_32120 [Bryobacteraceae bacterium]|jgi:hypothetical protein
MTIKLDARFEERVRKAAESEHVPVEQYVVEALERDIRHRAAAPVSPGESRASNLMELFANSPFKRVDLAIERDPAPIRDLEF